MESLKQLIMVEIVPLDKARATRERSLLWPDEIDLHPYFNVF